MDGSVSVFISYSHEDRPLARRIADSLAGYGLRVWIDEGELMIGDSIIERISAAIADVQFVVAIVSESSVKSHWCQKELALAVSGGLQRKGVKVLPLRLGNAVMPATLSDIMYLQLERANVSEIAGKVTLAAMRHSAESEIARSIVFDKASHQAVSLDRGASQPELHEPVSAYAETATPPVDARLTGIVKWFNSEKGYGFLKPDNGGPDVFVYYPAIATPGLKYLVEGQRVEFGIEQLRRGPGAINVLVVEDRPATSDEPEEARSRDNHMVGEVKWFNIERGYGFLKPDSGGPDVFVHYSAIAAAGPKNLFEGQRVEFGIEQLRRGPGATDVRVLDVTPPLAGRG